LTLCVTKIVQPSTAHLPSLGTGPIFNVRKERERKKKTKLDVAQNGPQRISNQSAFNKNKQFLEA